MAVGKLKKKISEKTLKKKFTLADYEKTARDKKEDSKGVAWMNRKKKK